MISKSLTVILAALQQETFSIRYNRFWFYTRPDNSLFALSSTLFVLQSLNKHFSKIELESLGLIGEKIQSRYAIFRNKDDKPSYNFYPTKPSRHFGNGYFMKHFDHFRLPDDIDDTALVFLTDPSRTSELPSLIELLKKHEHPSGVYNTWYGKNMPLEVDICANINMLILLFKDNLAHLPIAQNIMSYLINSIADIEKRPFQLARHYGHPVLILYHYARFMHLFPDTLLQAHVSTLVKITEKLLANALSDGHRMLAETSLLKWGIGREILLGRFYFNDFYTFIGAPLAPFIGDKPLAFKSLFLIYWQSDIYNEALKLEYLLFYHSQNEK